MATPVEWRTFVSVTPAATKSILDSFFSSKYPFYVYYVHGTAKNRANKQIETLKKTCFINTTWFGPGPNQVELDLAQGRIKFNLIWTYLEFSYSVLVFVRGIIWHLAERYNCNIMSQILSFLSHVTALAVGSITSLHNKISAIFWYHFFVWISIPLDGAAIDGDMMSIVLNTFLARSS